jgi:hypothetical protein
MSHDIYNIVASRIRTIHCLLPVPSASVTKADVFGLAEIFRQRAIDFHRFHKILVSAGENSRTGDIMG